MVPKRVHLLAMLGSDDTDDRKSPNFPILPYHFTAQTGLIGLVSEEANSSP